jgi:hypothetical protein
VVRLANHKKSPLTSFFAIKYPLFFFFLPSFYTESTGSLDRRREVRKSEEPSEQFEGGIVPLGNLELYKGRQQC